MTPEWFVVRNGVRKEYWIVPPGALQPQLAPYCFQNTREFALNNCSPVNVNLLAGGVHLLVTAGVELPCAGRKLLHNCEVVDWSFGGTMDLVDRFDVVMYAALTDVRPSQAGQWLWDNDLGGETEEAHAEVVPWFSNYLDKAWQDFSNRRLHYSPATDFMEIWRFPTKEHAGKLCRVAAPPEISKVLWHSYGGPWGTLDLEKD